MRDSGIGIEQLEGLRIGRGRVADFSEDGRVLVQGDAGGELVSCLVLTTSAGGALPLAPGDRVLIAAGDDNDDAIVLGVVGPAVPWRTPSGAAGGTLQGNPEHGLGTGHLPHAHVHAGRVHIHADEELEITCGEASLTMKKEGKVVVRGTNLISRSSGSNKIKGASVAIN